MEELFVLLIIDPNERRAVQTFIVPKSYFYASLPDDKMFHMKFKGECVEIMCDVNP